MVTDQPERTFVDRMGHAAEADGMSPIAGRLFATLVLADSPLSLDELAESLGVSKASVSTDARRLFERGIVERVRKPGDRRDYYELTPSFFVQTMRSRTAQWARLQQFVTTLRDSGARLSPTVRERIDSMDEINALLVARIDAALDEWEQQARRRSTKVATRRRKSA